MENDLNLVMDFFKAVIAVFLPLKVKLKTGFAKRYSIMIVESNTGSNIWLTL